jgi:hypothetical protein
MSRRLSYEQVETPKVSWMPEDWTTSKAWASRPSTSLVPISSTCLGRLTVSLGENSSDPLGYSAIDFTLLDPHYGTMQEWKDLIDAMHARGMYIILDFTVGTMGDFLGFKEYVVWMTSTNV